MPSNGSPYATRTNVSYFGQPRASLTSAAWGVPQAGSDGKIDASWIPAGGGDVDSVTGTSNEITASPTTGNVVLSLPSALTFTGKTITGGTFSSPTLVTPALGTPASGNLANCTGYVGTSALVTVGALNSGSITSGFGSIDIGTDTLAAGNTTITGTLSATGQATFTAGSNAIVVNNAGGDSRMVFQDNGVSRLIFGISSTTNGIITGSVDGSPVFRWNTGSALFSANDGSTAHLAISSSGISTPAGVIWNLGAANVVSPTSPNRTLTVTVGGTTYYIAAKTTND